MPVSTIISIITTAISLISGVITILVYLNSVKTTKQVNSKYIYELRLQALKSTKEVEVVWQTLINDIYHEQQRISGLEAAIAQNMKVMLDDVKSGLVRPSLENVKNIRKHLEEDFDGIDEEEAKLAIRKMEIIKMTLRQSQEEALRKYKLMYNKIEEQLSSSRN